MEYIIVDTNTWSPVFNNKDKNHANFKLVYEYIMDGKCVLAYGGTKYFEELEKCESYLKLHNQFKTANMARTFDADDIDAMVGKISALKCHRDLDDQHIIALQVVSKAKVICSKDVRAHKFFKDKALYPKKHRMPKIYSQLRHKEVLENAYT